MGILDAALAYAPKYPKAFRQSGRIVGVQDKVLEEYGVTQTVYTIADPKQQATDKADFTPIKSKDGTWSVSVKSLETRTDKVSGAKKLALAKGYENHLLSLATALGVPAVGFVKDTAKGKNDAKIQSAADLEDALMNAEVVFVQHVYKNLDKDGKPAVNKETGEPYTDTIVYDFESIKLPTKTAGRAPAIQTVSSKSKVGAKR